MKLNNITEEYAIYGMLFSLSNRIQTIGDREMKDITLKQQFLMIALEMLEQPPTLKEMGDLIGCSYQNVKRMAQHLEKQEYLKIIPDTKDRRKLLLVSNGKIDQLAKETSEVSQQFMKTLYADILREDLAVTLKTLMRMDQNIGGIVE